MLIAFYLTAKIAEAIASVLEDAVETVSEWGDSFVDWVNNDEDDNDD